MTVQLSPIARQVPGVRDPNAGGFWRKSVFGLLVHTTGGGVTALAKKQKRTPLDVALQVYINAQNGGEGYLWGGPNYVMTHDGSIHQIAPDNKATQHAGSWNRGRYFDGSWDDAIPKAAEQWRKRWPSHVHPYALFPSTSPNWDYTGVEMIPCGDGFGTPMRPGLRFTREQHDAAIRLAHDCSKRHQWPKGWQRGARLVGHEDVDPLSRSDSGGGWDPGWLRMTPWFDFDYVRNAVEMP